MQNNFGNSGKHVIRNFKLDDIITESMLLAERRCCRKKYISLWSPKVYQASLIIQYFNLLSKNQKQKSITQHRLT
jgi:hypothetical protein